MSNLREYYDTCKDFKDYVDRVIKTRDLNESVEQVLEYKIIQNVAAYYMEERRK